MAPGWSWDDADGDPATRRDAANAFNQHRRLTELIRAAVSGHHPFALSTETLCELARLAVEGQTPRPGALRGADVEIMGSAHVPPPWTDVPRLLDEMCAYVNAGGRDAMHLAAFTMWRINWIHPFENGNGRAARAASYLVLSACLGRELAGRTSMIERCLQQKIRYWRCLEAADAAWREGRLDVTAMEAFLEELVTAQLDDALLGR